jgi:WD40 repeat protein
MRFLLILALSLICLNGEAKKLNTKELGFGGYKGNIPDFCFSPSGNVIIFPERNRISFYDTGSKALLNQWSEGHSRQILSLDISADSLYLASGGLDSTVMVWDLPTGKIIQKLRDFKGVVTTLNFSPAKKLLAAGSSDKSVTVYDLTGNKIICKIEWKAEITKVKFSPDGEMLAIASLGKEIGLYNPVTGQQIVSLKGHRSSVRDLCFDMQKNILYSCGDDSRLIQWDLNKFKAEKVQNYRADWLLTVDKFRDATAVSGLNSVITITNQFASYSVKAGNPVNRIQFLPNSADILKLAIATRNGLVLWDTSQ